MVLERLQGGHNAMTTFEKYHADDSKKGLVRRVARVGYAGETESAVSSEGDNADLGTTFHILFNSRSTHTPLFQTPCRLGKQVPVRKTMSHLKAFNAPVLPNLCGRMLRPLGWKTAARVKALRRVVHRLRTCKSNLGVSSHLRGR